jgi:hypothetical protein
MVGAHISTIEAEFSVQSAQTLGISSKKFSTTQFSLK